MRHTILIPTKDRPEMLKRALRSALRALGDQGEVLVIDDRSNTAVVEVLADFKDPRIRIYVNEYSGGVSGVRNFGMSKARGEIVFFLDDDDEIRADYCHKILEVIKASTAATYDGPDYGFSAIETVSDNGPEGTPSNVTAERAKFKTGLIPRNAHLWDQMFGFSWGFWVFREVFLELGDIDENLSVSEDTEYGCRLLQHNKQGWYCADVGVRMHQHSSTASSELDHITARTDAAERERCHLYLCEKYPRGFRSLGCNYVKQCVKSRRFKVAWGFAAAQIELGYRVHLYAFILMKIAAYKLTGRLAPRG